jgi:hypothetical protein
MMGRWWTNKSRFVVRLPLLAWMAYLSKNVGASAKT